MIADENVAPQLGKNSKIASKKGKTIEETYTKKTQLEHILLRPDTYVGSVEKQTQQMWVFDAATRQIVNRPTTFVPGLYKIFDEIIVNASDNKQRDASMNKIEVVIDAEKNFIRVWNNGNGIPVVIHQEHKIYVPELIFGNLLTGSNFDDDEAKTTGGRNGYGAKLANAFSKQFVVETADKSRCLKFKQVFRDNMSSKSTPEVTSFNGTDYTCITFYPDLARFKMDRLDEDIVALLSKRVYDIAGTNTASGAKLSVFLNGSKVEAKNFEQYIGLYQGIEPPCAFERVSDRWEIGVGVSDGTFQQVSFVNSICTMKGGCHVNYIADQITAKLMAVVKKKNKGQEVKAHQIKNHLAIYVNALIVNPAFDSQTKENLTTKSSAFGSTCAVSEKLLKQVEKSGIIDNVLNWAKFKQTAELKRKGGSKRSKLTGIIKLDDANFAGSGKSHECTLILTEGDSAKALAISGLGVVGRDYYGVFPLKGKLLNVREASHAQIMKNEEIQNIAKILGLTFGKSYTETSSLRYGHLMIMTDQDHDGSHIKGLLINFLHHFWPSLLHIDGFLQQFITPIVKCSKGAREMTFFTIPEYQGWKDINADGKGWKIKYYKGLGTSTSAEAKEYFSHLGTHQIDFAWDEKADDMVDMAFAKKRVEDRKMWLLNLEPGVHIDYNVDRITYNEFVNKELILFSHSDNERSIPHFVDGLKPSQRKVLFACFKRNLRQEIKVAQLAGYISEHAAYHHGEASLTQTIIGMAQNYVGSNNINLLSPCGQFGTRLMGGKDAASARYVFTKLEPITRCIFHPHDDPLLTYLDDDGQTIEPFCYVPVIPMALVNGSDGIGTGWSTSVPTYNPREIIANLRLMLKGQEPSTMKPWYRGFTGDVIEKTGKDCNNFTVSGAIEVVDESTVIISELPVGKWTTDYKQFLESLLIGAAPAPKEGDTAPTSPPFIKDFKENHTDTSVLFTITVPPEKLTEAVNEKGGLFKRFKLDTSIATSNMNMFDMGSMIRKFESPADVMFAFYDVRLSYYDKRKAHLTSRLGEDWQKLDNKVRFILAVISGKLVVANRKKADLMLELKAQGFTPFADKKPSNKEDEAQGDGAEEREEVQSDLDRGYDYLLSMKIWSLTHERVAALTSQRDDKRRELDELLSKTPEDLWLEDLDALEVALDAFEADIEDAKRLEAVAQKKARSDRAAGGASKGGKAKGRAVPTKKGRAHGSDDDDDVFDDDESDFEDKKSKAKAKPKAQAKKKDVGAASTITSFFAPTAGSAGSAGAVTSTGITLGPVRRPLADVTGKDDKASGAAVKATKKAGAPTSSAPGPPAANKPKAAPKVAQRIDLVDNDDEDMPTLSLAERLAAKSSSSLFAAAAAAPPSASVVASKPRAKPAAKKATKRDEEDMFVDDEDEEAAHAFKEVAVSKRPARAAVAKPKVYTVDSEDDDDVDDDDDDDGDESEDDDLDDDASDDEFEESPPPKASKASKASKVPQAAAQAAAAGAKGIKRPIKASTKGVDSSIAAAAAAMTSSPVRTLGKSAGLFDAVKANVVYSPGLGSSPATKKKAKVSKSAKGASMVMGSLGSMAGPTKAAAPTKVAATKAAPGPKAKRPQAPTNTKTTKKKSVIESDDELDDGDDEEEEEAAMVKPKTPKPTRQRKAQNYASYFQGESEEEASSLGDYDSEFDE